MAPERRQEESHGTEGADEESPHGSRGGVGAAAPCTCRCRHRSEWGISIRERIDRGSSACKCARNEKMIVNS